MSKPAPWIIRKLPHLMTAAFVLVAIPTTYSSTFSDVSPAHYNRLAGIVEEHPELAQDVADAMADDVITHGEYARIRDRGAYLSTVDAKDRLRSATETSLSLQQALDNPLPLSATP